MNTSKERRFNKHDNQSLQARKDQAFARGQGTLTSVFIERAENAELWDVEGRRYIDLVLLVPGKCSPVSMWV